MDRTLGALRVAEKISDGIPVPFLKCAITVASQIVEAAENAKQTREQCRQLAERAARLTLAVYDQLRNCSEGVTSHSTTEHLAMFLCTLEEIDLFMRRQGKKKFLSALASQSRMNESVSRLAGKLDDAFKIFNIQSALHTNEQLSLLTDGQIRLIHHADDAERIGALVLSRTGFLETKIVEMSQQHATQDGVLRLFGREDIDLLEEIGTELQGSSRPDEKPVVRYRAQLRHSGSSVVVRRFPLADRRFASAVEFAKRVWHPYIVQTIGISRPDPYQIFIVQDWPVVDGNRWVESLNTLEGITKLSRLLQCIKQLSSAFDFMELHGLRWPATESERHLLFPPDLRARSNGTLQWDLGSWALPVLPSSIDLPNLFLLVQKGMGKDLRTQQSDRKAGLKQLFFNVAQYTLRGCQRTWTGSHVPSVGQCYSLSHPCIAPFWHKPSLFEWSVSGPRRYACICKAQLAARPPPLARVFGNGVECERQAMLGGTGESSVREMEIDESDFSKILPEDTVALPDGWRRHTVRNGVDPVLGFTLLVDGDSWRDISTWFLDIAINKLPFETAEDLAIAVRLRMYIITGWMLPADDDNDANQVQEEPEVLYYYEDLQNPRRGGVLEPPLGYWSTRPDDLSSQTNEKTRHNEALCEERGISLLGVTESGALVYEQRLNTLRIGFQVRVVIDRCHLTDDECVLLQEIHNLDKDVDSTSGPVPPCSSQFEEYGAGDSNKDNSVVGSRWRHTRRY